MKKFLLFALLACCPVLHGQIVNIPDADFKSMLLNEADTNDDGEIQVSEAQAVTLMHYSATETNPGSIADLTGIEAFTNLTDLRVSYHQLTSLDLSNNLNLQILHAAGNSLTSLNISNCNELSTISISGNELTSLNLGNKPDLANMYCGDNQLTALDVSGCPTLYSLACSDNNLTSLNLGTNDVMYLISCGNNALTNLDVSGCPVLQQLACGYNELTSLNVSNNPLLTSIVCYNNLLTTIDVSNAPLLQELICANNFLTSIDLSNNSSLNSLNLSYNYGITSLDLSHNTSLTVLSCRNNHNLSYINLKNGNNNNMDFTLPDRMSSLSILETVCVDALNNTLTAYLTSAVGHPITFTENCVMGIEENSIEKLTVHPNPVNDILFINTPETIKQIELYNSLGQSILTVTNRNSVDVSGLSRGMYVIRISDDRGNTAINKIIKN